MLDDLTEKCPPAEACRDAFVRMSKATIKMCLSTTGFGARGGLGNSQLEGQMMDALPDPSTTSLNPNAPYFTQRTIASDNLQKRQPVFDYDLRDLFSDEESASRQFGRYANVPNLSMMQTQSLNLSQQVPIMKTENSNALSPQQYTSYTSGPLTSSTLSSPVMPSRMTVPNSFPAQQPSPSFGTTIPNSQTYLNFANTIQTQYPTMSPFSDLDFLDTLPLGQERSGGIDQGQAIDPAFADFNMDFGMGWDGSLPGPGIGEDGGGVDLFDGFFFGGTAG